MNDIPVLQNSSGLVRLLRARSQVYDEATRLLLVQVGLTVCIPSIAAVFGFLYPAVRPSIALLAILITIGDVMFVDRALRRRLKIAARISEQFDCELLDMPWSNLAAGSAVDPETVERAARAWRKGDGRLQNWYPASVGRAPMQLARVICQRTNLRYDVELRRLYGMALVVIAWIIAASLVAIGWLIELPFTDFVATAITPAAPVLIWALRDRFRQRDAAEALQAIKGEAEALFEDIRVGRCDPHACAARSRQFQDAIFARRASNPLLLPFVYRFVRPRMEAEMEGGVADLLRRAGFPADN
jgi:hypothetical protein